jgi:hypothetical protein
MSKMSCLQAQTIFMIAAQYLNGTAVTVSSQCPLNFLDQIGLY